MFNRLEKIDAQLPGIVIKDFVPLPNNEVRVDFNNDIDLKILKVAEQYKNYLVLLVPEKNKTNFTENDFYRRAVVAKIALNMTSPSELEELNFRLL